jgi:hypothetical protein
VYPKFGASKELIDRATTERIPLVVRGMRYRAGAVAMKISPSWLFTLKG